MKIEDELDFSVKESIRLQKYQEVREHLAPLISRGIGEAMKPYMDKMSDSMGKVNEAISSIKIEAPTVNVTVPEIKVPDVNVPEVKLPTINIPEIKVPDITVNVPEIKLPSINVPEPKVTVNIPETKFPDYPAFPNFPSEFSLRGVGLESPLPVQLRDADGSPFKFPTQTITGGGKHDFITIKGYGDSSRSSYPPKSSR